LKREGRWHEELIKEGGVDFLVESINAHPGDVAVIAIGPLTNLALAYHTDNSIGDKLGLLSIMGGSISAFGIREFFAAEFNFYLDAEAANITMKVTTLICRSSQGSSSTPSTSLLIWAQRRP
jgi:inosine-uridine nucleoside N-ribohydrolase